MSEPFLPRVSEPSFAYLGKCAQASCRRPCSLPQRSPSPRPNGPAAMGACSGSTCEDTAACTLKNKEGEGRGQHWVVGKDCAVSDDNQGTVTGVARRAAGGTKKVGNARGMAR